MEGKKESEVLRRTSREKNNIKRKKGDQPPGKGDRGLVRLVLPKKRVALKGKESSGRKKSTASVIGNYMKKKGSPYS